MTIRQIMDDFDGKRSAEMPGAGHEIHGREQTEQLLHALNKCFTDIVLPALFAVEKDLTQMGYWNQLNIGQSSSPDSDLPNIREITFLFYPEKDKSLVYRPPARDAVYRAVFKPTGDLRKIEFSFRFPKRLMPLREEKAKAFLLKDIDAARVNAFVEEFVLGAVNAYQSDMIFR